MRRRGQVNPRRSIGVSSRWGWGPSASERSRARDLVDERPLDVVLAQLTGAPFPLPHRDALDQRGGWTVDAARRPGMLDRQHARRFLAFRLEEIVVTIDPGQRRD